MPEILIYSAVLNKKQKEILRSPIETETTSRENQANSL